MSYHIDTGLIKDKFNEPCSCPLCEIEKIVEEQFLHEYLNDAVMDVDCQVKVAKKGFCVKHFDMLFLRHNKLSLSLHAKARLNKTYDIFATPKSIKMAKKLSEQIDASTKTCVICDLLKNSMKMYYKTVAELFLKEKSFSKTLMGVKGFCYHHYAELLRYSKNAGGMAKSYLEVLSSVQRLSLEKLDEELKEFRDKHDYRNANKPLLDGENALPNAREKFYGKKYE